jgi:hypothetical protein
MAATRASDSRNAKVVFLLVLSMSAGALTLLALENRPKELFPAAHRSLVAESSARFQRVEIHFALPGSPIEESAFDCVIYPNRPAQWSPKGGAINLLVVGRGGDADRLADDQVVLLLSILDDLNRKGGLPLDQVYLNRDSDVRRHPGLPAEARDLCALLVRKGLIR